MQMADTIFDLDIGQQRRRLAQRLGYDPDAPDTWPGCVDTLLVHHKQEAESRLWAEVRRRMSSVGR